MLHAATKNAAVLLLTTFTLCISSRGQCPVETVIIKGQVKDATADSGVRVQLIYRGEKIGESGEVEVQQGRFQLPLEFVTGGSSLFTNLPRKCGRRPQSVDVTLLENGEEASRVSLNFVKDFTRADASAYSLRSELVLQGTH